MASGGSGRRGAAHEKRRRARESRPPSERHGGGRPRVTGAMAGRTRSHPPRRNSHLQETGPRCRRSGDDVVTVWRPGQRLSLTCRGVPPEYGMLLRWTHSGTECVPMSCGRTLPQLRPNTTGGDVSSRSGSSAGTCPARPGYGMASSRSWTGTARSIRPHRAGSPTSAPASRSRAGAPRCCRAPSPPVPAPGSSSAQGTPPAGRATARTSPVL